MEDKIIPAGPPLLCFGTSDRLDKDVKGQEVNSEHAPLHLCFFPLMHHETEPSHLNS